MGEAAEMVLDGYLDWDGDYTGNTRSGYKAFNGHHTTDQYNRVFSLFRSWNVKPTKRWEIVSAFGQHLIAERKLSPEHKINFISEAANNWKQFRNFVKEYQRDHRAGNNIR